MRVPKTAFCMVVPCSVLSASLLQAYISCMGRSSCIFWWFIPNKNEFLVIFHVAKLRNIELFRRKQRGNICLFQSLKERNRVMVPLKERHSGVGIPYQLLEQRKYLIVGVGRERIRHYCLGEHIVERRPIR